MIHDFWPKQQKYFAWLIIVFLLVWGIYWRSYDWQSYSLGFDQVQILTQAEEITRGNFTLIGPRTGPASLFTGPLIYYLTALVQILSNSIVSAVLTPILLALMTALVLFFMAKHYFNFRSAIMFLLIWATAPLLLHLDRIFWNPNLSLLAFCLAFWPMLSRKKAQQLDLWLVGLGSFLSYQAHFSAFLLIPIVLFLIVCCKIDKKYLLALAFGFGLSLFPTLIFDLRHDWLNTRGLLGFSNQQGGQFNFTLVAEDFLNNLAIIVETLGKLFYQLNSFNTRVIFGVVLLAILIFVVRRSKGFSLWPSLSILLLLAGSFALYQGNKPEYYFLIIVPVFLMILLRAFEKLPKIFLALLLASQLIFSRQYMLEETRHNFDLSLGNCLAISQELQIIQNTEGISFLAYDLPYASDFGLKYLIEPLSLDEQGKVVHLLYPAPEEVESWQRIGRTAIIIEEKDE